LVSVKWLSYKPFVYLRLLITPLVSVRSLSYKPLDNDFTDTNGVIRSRKYTNGL
jgi:hypothetical protein